MLGVSRAYATLTKTSHDHIARVDVVQEGVVVMSLLVHAGSVDADRGNRFMRRFTATVADAQGDLTPANIRDILAPFGTILKLYLGVRIPVIADFVSLNETADDWNAGTSWGVQPNGSGFLVLGAPGHV
jgi:hypothetical protein